MTAENGNCVDVSTVNEVLNETESDPVDSIPEQQEQSKRKELNSTTFSAGAENTRALSQVEATVETEAGIATVLTETIVSMGEKFEKMGSTFETKLQIIESRHQKLEEKLRGIAELTNNS